MKILGQKKCPKGELSTNFIDVGELIQRGEPIEFSFDIINIGVMDIYYKIHAVSSPCCAIKFSKTKGIVPANEI